LEEKLGFSVQGRDRWPEGVVLLQVSWTEVDGNPTGGAHLSAEGGEGDDTLSGGGNAGPGPKAGLGRLVPCGLFYIFFCVLFFFFFCFLIYFISFANLIQINSNYFLNSSKNQHNVLK
jgi:hypothetical protein